ncbi:MAG: alpha/beta hydrolase [Anaerolineae bacterium]|nr:alpha/beta hydrolase [Anaerolineae bacterium]
MNKAKTNGKLNGSEVHYIVEGNGPPIILLHGMGSSIHNWDFLIPELVKAGYSAYALDLLGHGDSPKPDGPEQYHIEEVYTHFEKWVDALGFDEPVDVISHSMGGYLGLNFARRQADKVKRLVLVDPFYSPKQVTGLIHLTVRNPAASSKMLKSLPTWAFTPAEKWHRMVSNGMPATAAAQISQDFKRADPNILYTAPTTKDLAPKLSQVKQETLVLWGEKDLTLAPRSFPKLVDGLPNARGYSFPKTGHTPHLTKVNEFNRQVVDFIAA